MDECSERFSHLPLDGPCSAANGVPLLNSRHRITAEFDGSVYLTIVQGFGQMLSLAEDLTVRERWDVVNYVRTLPVK